MCPGSITGKDAPATVEHATDVPASAIIIVMLVASPLLWELHSVQGVCAARACMRGFQTFASVPRVCIGSQSKGKPGVSSCGCARIDQHHSRCNHPRHQCHHRPLHRYIALHRCRHLFSPEVRQVPLRQLIPLVHTRHKGNGHGQMPEPRHHYFTASGPLNPRTWHRLRSRLARPIHRA